MSQTVVKDFTYTGEKGKMTKMGGPPVQSRGVLKTVSGMSDVKGEKLGVVVCEGITNKTGLTEDYHF